MLKVDFAQMILEPLIVKKSFKDIRREAFFWLLVEGLLHGS